MNAQEVTTARQTIDNGSPAAPLVWTRRPTSDAEHVVLRLVGTIVVLGLVAGVIFVCWLWYRLANMTFVF